MNKRVLLVDDSETVIQFEKMILRGLGLELSSAKNGKLALDQIAAQKPDLVLLDLMMPDMDGIETLKRLKIEQPDSQVILLTGHATVEKGIEAMKLGAVDFLEKPADLSTLTQKIKKAHAQKMLVVQKRIEEKVKKIMGVKGW
jgi:DNA-binding NtrC family response regulator